MQTPFKKNWIVVAVIVVVAGMLAWAYTKSPSDPAGSDAMSPDGQGQEDSVSETESPGAAMSTGDNREPRAPAQNAGIGAMTVVTPVAGEIWSTEKSHMIRWSREAGYVGGIMLLDAATRATLGWITPNLLSDQVTYRWDTSAVALTRTNPLKEEIAPGTYIVRVVFDGPPSPIESAPFSITTGLEERILSREVSIRNLLFTPQSVTVSRGGQVAVVNDEQSGRIHTLHTNGTILGILPPRSTYAWSTQREPGMYEMGLVGYPLAKLIVVVE